MLTSATQNQKGRGEAGGRKKNPNKQQHPPQQHTKHRTAKQLCLISSGRSLNCYQGLRFSVKRDQLSSEAVGLPHSKLLQMRSSLLLSVCSSDRGSRRQLNFMCISCGLLLLTSQGRWLWENLCRPVGTYMRWARDSAQPIFRQILQPTMTLQGTNSDTLCHKSPTVWLHCQCDYIIKNYMTCWNISASVTNKQCCRLWTRKVWFSRHLRGPQVLLSFLDGMLDVALWWS